jgi:hypothetical protein
MFQETRGVFRRIERDVLVHGARPQAPLGKASRGDGAGSEQEIEVGAGGAERLDHRQHGVRLTDARRMEPAEHAARPRDVGLPEALAAPAGVLLAAALAYLEDQRRYGT